MDKKLQKKLLEFIRDMNDKKGMAYNLILDDINKEFIKENDTERAKVYNNLKWLSDLGKIECLFKKDNTLMLGSPINITALGLQEFDSICTKFLRWFRNDMMIYKIATIFAAIVSIIYMVEKLLE